LFFMNMSCPASGKVALVNVIILEGHDNSPKTEVYIGHVRGDRRRGAEDREQLLDRHVVPGRHDTAADRRDHKLPSLTFAECKQNKSLRGIMSNLLT